MAAEHNCFRYVVPLQHIAKVRIIELLWRQSEVAKQSLMEELKEGEELDEEESYKHQPLVENLHQSVSRLPIPEPLKNELMLFTVAMVKSALDWLLRNITQQVMDPWLMSSFNEEMYSHFIDNFTWNDMGCPAGEAMLRSYVTGKDSIDFHIWKLLCNHCMEDDIIKFSTAFRWKESTHFSDVSPLCIYWYWKIYGELPTEQMYCNEFEEAEAVAEQCHSGGLYDVNRMVQSILNKSHSRNHIRRPFFFCTPALEYLRGELNDEEKFREHYLNTVDLEDLDTDAHLRMLGEMTDETWLSSMYATRFICHFAISWPSVLSLGHWVDMLGGRPMLPDHFLYMFRCLQSNVSFWETSALMGTYYEALLDRTVHSPFKEIARLFNEKFGSNRDLIYRITFDLFCQDNITFLGMFFERIGNPMARTDFLSDLEVQSQDHILGMLGSPDFCNRFMEQVLVTKEEKAFFRKIVNNRRLTYGTWDLEHH